MNAPLILDNLFDFNWEIILVHTVQMIISFVLVLPIGYHRENSVQNIGLRTFPLVSLASCSFALIALEMVGSKDDGSTIGEIIAGIVTGIGFIGGGAILKENGMIEGTSTAAAIWAAGCVGVAVAMGRLEIAILISLFTYLIFKFVTPIKQSIEEKIDK